VLDVLPNHLAQVLFAQGNDSGQALRLDRPHEALLPRAPTPRRARIRARTLCNPAVPGAGVAVRVISR
jgi:hypothetical protein